MRLLFALQRQKEYGNRNEAEYVDWLIEFAAVVKKKLRGDGSFVVDLGGAYQKGVPSRSLYPFRVVTRFCDESGFVLAEDFEPVQSIKIADADRMGK